MTEKTPEQLLAEAVVETAKALAEKTARQNEMNKDALKEALKEWMDEKFTTLGKWTLSTIAAAVLMAAIYLLLTINGWKPPI